MQRKDRTEDDGERTLDYGQDLYIDISALEVEWLNQASLAQEYSEMAADARAAMDRAHERVKVVRSELILKAAEHGEAVIGAKPTGQTIEAYYRTHPRHKRAKEELINLTHEHEVLQAAVFAFQQRKAALENLVKLLGMDYFAGPKSPKGEPENYRKKASVRKKVNQRMLDKVKKKGTRK